MHISILYYYMCYMIYNIFYIVYIILYIIINILLYMYITYYAHIYNIICNIYIIHEKIQLVVLHFIEIVQGPSGIMELIHTNHALAF